MQVAGMQVAGEKRCCQKNLPLANLQTCLAILASWREFYSGHHARRRVDADEHASRPGGRDSYSVLRNNWTEYAIRTFADSPNVGLAIFILILIQIPFSDQALEVIIGEVEDDHHSYGPEGRGEKEGFVFEDEFIRCATQFLDVNEIEISK